MRRALYSFLHQLVEAPVPTWRLGMLVVQWSFEVLPPSQLMTTTTAAHDGALSAFPSHSLSHRQGHHPQSVRPPYVACYPIRFSISDAHLSKRPDVLAPYLHGGVPRLLLYGHRDIYVVLLLGQQRHVQVWLLLWVTRIGLWHIHWLLLFLVVSMRWGTTDLWATVVCIRSSKSMVNIP